MMSKDNLRCK